MWPRDPGGRGRSRRGLNRVLALLGMAEDPDRRWMRWNAARPGQRFLWLHCQHEGWWEPAVQVGDSVAQA